MNPLNFRIAPLYVPAPLTRVEKVKRWLMHPMGALELIALGAMLGAIIGVRTSL